MNTSGGSFAPGTTNTPAVMNITKLSSAAIGRNLLVKFGADANHIALCGAADTPIGVTVSTATAAEQPVAIALLSGGVTMTSGAAIAYGSTLEPAANGKVQTLGGGVGTHLCVGQALTGAAGADVTITASAQFFIRDI